MTLQQACDLCQNTAAQLKPMLEIKERTAISGEWNVASSRQVSVCSVQRRFIIAGLGRLGQSERFTRSQTQKLRQEQSSSLGTASPQT